MKHLSILVSLVLVFALLLGGCSGDKTTPVSTSKVAQTEMVTLKIGSLPRIFDLVLYAADQDGTFQKNNLKVEIVPFTSTVERNSAFQAGQLDGFVDSIYEAINMNKEVQSCQVAGHALMPGMFKIVVSPQSGITNAAQLKGAKIATSTGSIMDYALDKLLATQNLKNSEVTYVNVPKMPLRLTMLETGEVKAAIFTPPLSEQAIASGNKLVLDDSKTLLAGPGLIFNMNIVKNKALAIQNFVKSWDQEVAIIKSNPDKYRALLVKTAQVPETLASTYTIPVFPEVHVPTKAEVNDLADWMKARGLITANVNYDQLIIK